MDIYDIIEKIGQRPGMYLGAESITCFYQFVTGYHWALKEMGYRYEKLYPMPFYELFPSYCAMKHQTSRNIGYPNIMLEKFNQNEKKAFRYFFEVLDEFKENVRITGLNVCDLSEENISFHMTNHHVVMKGINQDGNWTTQPAYKTVKRLYHVALSYDAHLLIPVSEDENVSGTLLYHEDDSKKDALSVFDSLQRHMERCFGEVVWHKAEASDKQTLCLLNDYFFNNKRTTISLE